MRTNEKMTVKRLIEMLSHLPEDAEVRIRQPSHDYWRTMLAGEVRSVEMERLEWSDYHSTYVVPQSPDDDEGAANKTLEAVVIG
jgi:hypothetical protein